MRGCHPRNSFKTIHILSKTTISVVYCCLEIGVWIEGNCENFSFVFIKMKIFISQTKKKEQGLNIKYFIIKSLSVQLCGRVVSANAAMKLISKIPSHRILVFFSIFSFHPLLIQFQTKCNTVKLVQHHNQICAWLYPFIVSRAF